MSCAPLIAGHRRIGRSADATHSGNGAEPVLNLTIKRDQLFLLMARQYGAVDGNQIAVLRIEPEVLVLQIAQAAAQHRSRAQQAPAIPPPAQSPALSAPKDGRLPPHGSRHASPPSAPRASSSTPVQRQRSLRSAQRLQARRAQPEQKARHALESRCFAPAVEGEIQDQPRTRPGHSHTGRAADQR